MKKIALSLLLLTNSLFTQPIETQKLPPSIQALQNIVADFKAIRITPTNPALRNQINQDWSLLNQHVGELSLSIQSEIANRLSYWINYDATQPLNIDDGLSSSEAIFSVALINPKADLTYDQFAALFALRQFYNYVDDFNCHHTFPWDWVTTDLSHVYESFSCALTAEALQTFQAGANLLDMDDWEYDPPSTPPGDPRILTDYLEDMLTAFDLQINSFSPGNAP